MLLDTCGARIRPRSQQFEESSNLIRSNALREEAPIIPLSLQEILANTEVTLKLCAVVKLDDHARHWHPVPWRAPARSVSIDKRHDSRDSLRIRDFLRKVRSTRSAHYDCRDASYVRETSNGWWAAADQGNGDEK